MKTGRLSLYRYVCFLLCLFFLSTSVPVSVKAEEARLAPAGDNDLNAEIAIVQLEEIGIKMTRAADGKQAVELFKENQAGTFDLILMDVMMPQMNGYEATAAIRTLPDRPDGRRIPIIALTANAFAEDVQTSMEAGMNGHLSKPIVVDELVKAIIRNLGQ